MLKKHLGKIFKGGNTHMGMVTSDPIADMLTRIRNANTAKHDTVDVPPLLNRVFLVVIFEHLLFVGCDCL